LSRPHDTGSLRPRPTRRSSDLERCRFSRLRFDPENGVATYLGMQGQPAAVPHPGGLEAALFPGLAALFVQARVQLRVDQAVRDRSEEHTSELQSRENLVCRLLL